jgi:hypothetical protein
VIFFHDGGSEEDFEADKKLVESLPRISHRKLVAKRFCLFITVLMMKKCRLNNFAIYKQHLPWATFREVPTGGHQFNEDLSIVAADIDRLFS